jgi:penicillin-binding protein 1A
MANQSFSSEEMQRYFNDPEYRRKHIRKGGGRFDRHRLFLYGAIVLGIGLLTWYTLYMINGLPPLEELENPRPELATKIYSSDGVVLDQLAYKNRTHITLDKLPSGLIKGLVATEDKDFYSHWGVNLPRFIRQMVLNVLTFRQAGASTITQQLARNLYKLQIRHERWYNKVTRKAREFITAVQIERNFTKNEILEMYLNVAFFGRNAYGIESAAETYFGKPATDLEPAEYTLLIGMLKGPSYFDPISHPDRTFARRDLVIEQMVKEGLLTPELAQQVHADSLDFKIIQAEFRSGMAPHFVEMIRQALVKKRKNPDSIFIGMDCGFSRRWTAVCSVTQTRRSKSIYVSTRRSSIKHGIGPVTAKFSEKTSNVRLKTMRCIENHTLHRCGIVFIVR